MKTILLVEDNGFVRELLSDSLKEYEVIAFGSGNEALKNFKMINPDIVLSDIYLQDTDGLTMLETIRKVSEVPVILFTAAPNKHFIKNAIQNRATAFLIKQEGFVAEINFVVKMINNIKTCYLGNGTSGMIKDDYLTRREYEIAQMMSEGKTSKAIAESLFISIHTVSNHRKNIKEKLQYGNLAQLSTKLNSEFAV
jgi:DNA-binding NarL/FixJ family response regulator